MRSLALLKRVGSEQRACLSASSGDGAERGPLWFYPGLDT
jgi:hypothetical protein